MSSKIPAIIAFACCLSVSAVRAQSSVGRVGPVEDVPAAASAAGSAENKKGAVKSDPNSAPKKDGETNKAKTDEPKKSEAKKDDPKIDPKHSDPKNDPPPPTTLTTAAANATEKSPANSTTDAPPKTSDGPAPVREARPVGLIPPPPKYEAPTPINADGSATTTGPTAAVSAPAASAAAPPTATYRVGTGDMLDIRLVNSTGRDSTLYTILTGGMLDYPLAGDPIGVSGLTTDEVATRLSAELKRRGIYDHAQFHITVRDYASHTVMVSGLVDQPGQKVLRREAVPLYVVLADALPRADAGRAVIISRATGASKTVDLGDPTALNELVSAGDVVNVQPRPPEFFYIGGMIAAPGQKDFHAGITLTQSILASGGVTSAAGNRAKVRVTVSRQGADGRLIATDYLLQEIESGQVPDPRLQPGDRIEIGRKR